MKPLEEILLQGYESKDIDYKGPFKWDEGDKKACCEIVKDILAMANTLGGYIVIGVEETGKGFNFIGLTNEQADSFETSRINRFLQNYTDPPINTLLKKITHEGKTFAVIEIPRFSDTPHICQKDFPSTLTSPALYVRTDTNESAPLRSSSDFRAIVENAVRNRSDQILTSMRAILTGSATQTSLSDSEKFEEQLQEALNRLESLKSSLVKGYSGYREAFFHPSQFDEKHFSIDELRFAVKRAEVNFSGWPFLYWNENRSKESYIIQDGLETFIIHGPDRLDFWRLQQSGFFYHRVLMREEGYAQSQNLPPSLDFGDMARYVAEAIYCLTRVFEDQVPEDAEITLRIRVLGTEGRVLTTFDSNDWMPAWLGYVCKIPELVYKNKLPMADWKTGTVDLAVEICKEIFIKFNCLEPDVNAIRHKITKMFSRRF